MTRLSSGIATQSRGGRSVPCSECGTADSDPAGNGYCQSCGTVFKHTFRKRLNQIQLAAAAGAILASAGGFLSLAGGGLYWLGLLLVVLGVAALGFAVFGIRRSATRLLASLEMRQAPETSRLLSITDLLNGGLLVFFLAALGACSVALLQPNYDSLRNEAEATFGDKLKEFAEMASPLDKLDAERYGEPRRIGKVLVVSVEREDDQLKSWHVDPAHVRLAEDIRAETPGDVQTVALVDYRDTRVGTYNPGDIPAFRVDATVTLVDAGNQVPLDRLDFEGGSPPASAPTGGVPGRGEPATERIIEYLTKLPDGQFKELPPEPAEDEPPKEEPKNEKQDDTEKATDKSEKPKAGGAKPAGNKPNRSGGNRSGNNS